MGVVGLEGMNHQIGWLFAFANHHNVLLRYGNRKSLFSLANNKGAPRRFLGNW